jgi:predicted phage tail protein
VQSTTDFVIDSAGIAKNVTDSNKFSIDVSWSGITGISTSITQTAVVELQYRLAGSSTWIPLEQHTFSGRITAYQYQNQNNNAFGIGYTYTNYWGYSTGYAAPSGTKTFSFAPSKAKYEFRVVQLSGYGTSKINSGIIDIDAYTDIISGKTISRYQKSYSIALPAGGPWDVRLRRITDDATTANIQNKTYWDSYTEIIDAKLRYPNSAICGIEIDAQQFNNIPSRGYEIDGILIKVPVNYDPITRTYSGVWNGTFKTAWSNNPAWVFYDLITTNRYGLGDFIAESQVDKWALYQIAQYCDEMIDDGFGASEPRFTVNLYLQTREEAYRVLNNLASTFRAINYWSSGAVTTVQDAPSDPIALFTAANVIGGAFNYQGSSARTRHTVALVSWNDPEDSYAQKVEYVADDEGIARYGVQQTDVVAFGCTSRGQAHRFGKSILYTERMESEVISFRTGLDGVLVYPGAVINTHDVIRAGKRFGGRIMAATDSDITL